MTGVSSLFARLIIANANVSKDPRELLRLAGIEPDAPPNPKQMIPEDVYCGLLEAIVRDVEGPVDFHLRTGATIRCEHLGVLGLAWKSAPHLGDSFERLTRYGRLVNRVTTFELRESGSHALVTARRAGKRLGALLSNEAGLMTVLSLTRESAGASVTPVEIRYRHSPQISAPALESHFGCPVLFDQETDALVFEREVMALPNRLGDEPMHGFFSQHLEEELSSDPVDAPLDERVRVEITARLSGGLPRISDIASPLGMSPRTLQRRLSEREISYQSLVDEARRRLAERLLGQTDHSLAEIAFLTGFSEQSGFTRAFKRWSGRTPRSFRLEPIGGRAGVRDQGLD